MDEINNKIISFLIEPQFTGALYYIRAVFISISAILFFAILILFSKSSWFKHRYAENTKEFVSYSPLKGGKISKNWGQIIERLKGGTDGDYKMAIIEADNMLLESLEKMEIKGDSFSEKLSQINAEKLKNIEDVKIAHKIRNNIVYDPDYKITEEEAKRAIDIYRVSFQNLDIF